MKIRNNGIAASQSVSGTFTQSLSGYTQFNLNLTNNTKLEYSDATTGIYDFVVNAGSYNLNLGTYSNYKIISSDLTVIGSTGSGLSGSFTLQGIYDGSEMLMTYKSPFITMPKGGGAPPSGFQRGNMIALDAANATSYPGSGTSWYDLSGNGNTVTLYNSPSYSSGYITFNGSDQYGLASNSSSLGTTTAFTMEYWFQISSEGDYIVLSKAPHTGGSDNQNGNYTAWLGTGYNIFTSVDSTTSFSNYFRADPPSSYSTNTLYQVAMTYDGTTAIYYLNGSALSTTTVSGPYDLYTTTEALQIARRKDGYGYLNGKLSVINLWNTVLTPTEIADQYTNYSTRN